MNERYIRKLGEWFGDFDFNYIVLNSEGEDCIVLTIHNNDEKTKELGLFRLFKIRDNLSISEDKSMEFSITDNKDLLISIEKIIKTYNKIIDV